MQILKPILWEENVWKLCTFAEMDSCQSTSLAGVQQVFPA